MTRYEPHCDCLGGHVSMVPDPNGLWCRADDPRAVATQPALGYDPDCPECKGTGQRDSGGTHPWGEPAMMMCDCDAPQRAVADDGWQDISTAPKDGTCVILWVIEDHNGNGHMLWPCMMLHDEWCWEISDNRNLDYDYEIIERCEITHWRPLPEPPTPNPTEADHD